MEQELRRRRRIKRLVDAVGIAASVAGALVTNAYLLLNSGAQLTRETIRQTSQGTLISIAILIAIGFAVGSRAESSLWDWYFESVDDPSTRPPAKIRQQALNVPINSALLSLGMWGLAGIIAGISMSYSLEQRFDWAVFTQIFMGMTVISGSIAAILTYFALERIWQNELPIFFPEGDLAQSAGFRVTLRLRLLVLFFTSSIPLILLAITSYNQAVYAAGQPLPNLLIIEWLVAGSGLLLAIILALTMGANLVNSVERLRQHMLDVRQGSLEVQLPVTANDEMGDLAAGFNLMVQGLRQEEVIRRLFGRYVSPEVAEHAIAHGSELGGQRVECTVLFADIRGFTSLTERMDPDRLIAMLNRYFQHMAAAVTARGGLVNKFGGDSLLAVFGTPVNPAAEHAQQAVQAAQDMLAALERFNQEQAGRQEPALRIGIGVATGSVLAGNVGSDERLEYTVIGDAVNLASRLEGMTKQMQTPVLISAATVEKLGRETALVEVGEVAVRGKQAPVKVYRLESLQESILK
ncbi:MAG: adenylate/guanylate cyclase domain-containing protein [Chloroflexia bacterium]|nr:adenylate/guanylate cyclase domain-containing protein [Chloroflexia bacterium]